MRYFSMFVMLVITGILLTGCGGSKTTNQIKNSSDMPDFVLNPPKQEGYIFGTGIAEQSSMQLAKETADLRAKKEIATVLSSKVSIMLKDFLGQAGIGNNAETSELTQSVTRSMSESELIGIIIEKREYKNGKMYSLAKYPLDASTRDAITKVVQNSLSSKEALLSQFRAKQGFEELDKQIEKMKTSEQ